MDETTDRRLTFHEVDGGTAVWWDYAGAWTVLPLLNDEQKDGLARLIDRAVASGRADCKFELRQWLGIKE